MVKPKKRSSGPTLTYQQRKAKGRPIVGFSLPQATVDMITRLAERLGKNRSEVVDDAIRRMAKAYGEETGHAV